MDESPSISTKFNLFFLHFQELNAAFTVILSLMSVMSILINVK